MLRRFAVGSEYKIDLTLQLSEEIRQVFGQVLPGEEQRPERWNREGILR
jgi:hypothetical protein